MVQHNHQYVNLTISQNFMICVGIRTLENVSNRTYWSANRKPIKYLTIQPQLLTIFVNESFSGRLYYYLQLSPC